MTTREFKPGDVVSMYVASRRRRHRAVRVEDNLDGAVYQWRLLDGDDSSLDLIADRIVEDVRPLVVIDLPDGALAGWPVLIDALRKAREETGYRMVFDGLIKQIAAQTTPPKPPEPTGLGAVVEDVDGVLWLRSYLPDEDADTLNKPWKNGPVCKNWQIVDAIRVLSEGVTP